MHQRMDLRVRSTATLIALVAMLAALLTATPAQASASASISGTITAGGVPLPGATVTLLVDRAEGNGRWWDSAGQQTTTNDDGTYRLAGIEPRISSIRVDPPQRSWLATTWWGGGLRQSGAKPIDVTAGVSVTDINANLSVGGAITGRVLGPDGKPGTGLVVALSDTRDPDVEPVATAIPGRSGDYSFERVPAGEYSVTFIPWSTSPLVPEVWPNAHVSEPGAPVAVTAGQTTRGVNAQLESGVRAAGRLTADGEPLHYNGRANFYAGSGTALTLVDTAWIGEEGRFEIISLPAGTYRVEFVRYREPRSPITRWWKDAASAGTAKTITIAAGGSVSGLDADLSAALTGPTPTVSGTARAGATLTARAGTWTPGATLRYQWLLDGKAVSGATRSTWKVPSTAVGKPIAVRVVGSKAGYASVSKISRATTKVPRVGAVKVIGTAKVGRTLSVSRGTWTSGTTFTYRWHVNGKPVSKATKSTWRVPSSAAGKKVSVTVVGKRSGFTTVAVASTSTRPVIR